MRSSLPLLSLGLALAASPALAYTVLPSSGQTPSMQFADPDAALEQTSSALLQSFQTNNLPLQDGRAELNGANYGSAGGGAAAFGASAYARALDVGPSYGPVSTRTVTAPAAPQP